MLPSTTHAPSLLMSDDELDRSRHVVHGKYQLLRPIGRGGMGRVFAARCVGSGQHVAVKLLRRERSNIDPMKKRFLREAQILERLRHPNTVRLHDYGVDDDGTPYLVTELAVGETLGSILRNSGAIAEVEVLEIAIQVCDSIQEAHNLGVVHRDIKPANIIVDFSGPRPRVKVLDFGVGKSMSSDDHLTMPGQFVGSYDHCAPEQIAGEEADYRTDVYSIGVVMFEMLTGVRAFPAAVRRGYHGLSLDRRPPSFRIAAPDCNVSVRTEEVVLKCLERRREHRWSSAHLLAEALHRRHRELTQRSRQGNLSRMEAIVGHVNDEDGMSSAHPETWSTDVGTPLPFTINFTDEPIASPFQVGMNSRRPARRFSSRPAPWLQPCPSEATGLGACGCSSTRVPIVAAVALAGFISFLSVWIALGSSPW